MDEQTPFVLFLVAVVIVLVVAILKGAVPIPGAAHEPAVSTQSTLGALDPNATLPPASNASTSPTPRSEPPASNASDTTTPPSPGPAQDAPVSSAASSPSPNATVTDPAPNATGNATTPKAVSVTNTTVSWNATLADPSTCVPSGPLGVPVCAPSGGTGGPPTVVKLLGTRDLARGALDATWDDSSSAASVTITMRLLAGKDCDASGACSTMRALNFTTSGPGPLHLGVGNATLRANESLVLELSMDCGATFGSCAGTTVGVHVSGWLARIETAA